MRAPGMGYMRMPIFCWTALASNLLIVAAFPILTATFAMLLLDRYLGFHFFTNEAGGNPMMFINLIWAWGHPEVYILILPAFGCSPKCRDLLRQAAVRLPLDGHGDHGDLRAVVHGLAASLLHHGRRRRRQRLLRHHDHDHRGADRREDLQLAVHDVWRPIRFTVPMLWSIGFMVTFVIGGMTGVLLAVPPADFVLHNSLFLVAHFHNVIIGGVCSAHSPATPTGFPRRSASARRGLGQGRVLVLVHRLLPRLHAALRAGPDGHDAAHAALRRPRRWQPLMLVAHRRGADPGSASC
jgi:cytochrome o ubiquinol oxidase subunit 1